jgi:anhydro-N-acetylmuramic acid kinase
MANILRFDSARPGDPRRWTVGIQVSNDGRRLTAALVAAGGHGMEIRPQTVDGLAAPVPSHAASLFAQLDDPASALPKSEVAEAIFTVRSRLAEIEASVVEALLAQAGLPPGQLLAVGVHDPGLWSWGKAAGKSYLGLCDAALLAELSGQNVVDAFPARDLARGGQGGPLHSLPQWLLLRHRTIHRLLVDLGQTVRMTYLPPVQGGSCDPPVLSFEVGPGMRLIDLLAQRLSGGRHAFDPGGRLAVQGRRVEELVEHWLADPCFRRPLPRWHPRGVRPERFLVEAMRLAVDRGWSVRDLLCTATHVVARSIALEAQRRLPEDTKIDEVVLTGGGQQNGMLLREIALQMPKVTQTRIGDLGIESEILDPACVAILALFHVDQVPANRPEITGTEVARVLGRLTPGSPQSWQRLLAQMGASRPVVRPLRSAL